MIGKVFLPILTQLPFRWLYPTGKKQVERLNKFNQYFHGSEIIAGDWNYINRFLPEHLTDKIIITNTVTTDDISELKKRKASLLITSTPHIHGRSFGTNMIEALILVYAKKNAVSMTTDDYDNWLKKLNITPYVLDLNSYNTDTGSKYE